MALADIYQVTLFQSYLGQTLENVFFYTQQVEIGTTNWAVILGQLFQAQWSTDSGGLAFDSVAFSNNLLIDAIQVKNLFNPVEFSSILIGGLVQGGNTGVNDNPFIAYRFSCARLRGDMRNGQKFFGGLCVSVAVDGIINSTAQTALSSVTDALNEVYTYDASGDEATFIPCIVKRIREEPDEDHPDVWYRLPTNAGESDLYAATDWTLSPVLTTSNRRKFGRGI